MKEFSTVCLITRKSLYVCSFSPLHLLILSTYSLALRIPFKMITTVDEPFWLLMVSVVLSRNLKIRWRMLLTRVYAILDELEAGYGSVFLAWILNWFFVLGCMVGVFVYGDPIAQSKSVVASKFWAHHKQADYLLSQVCHLLRHWKIIKKNRF